MRLYLIRHAESENNALGAEALQQRKVDPDLTARGYEQRELLARHMSSAADAVGERFAISHLYVSAMYRTLLSAKPLGEALGLAPRVWLDLYEKGGLYRKRDDCVHAFPGLTRAEIQRGFPGFRLPEDMTESGWYDVALGREAEAHSHYRAIKVARELRERGGSDDVIALVSHAGFLDLLLKAIFGQLPSHSHTMRYYHDNTAITRVNYDGVRPTLHYMNRLNHLPAALHSY